MKIFTIMQLTNHPLIENVYLFVIKSSYSNNSLFLYAFLWFCFMISQCEARMLFYDPSIERWLLTTIVFPNGYLRYGFEICLKCNEAKKEGKETGKTGPNIQCQCVVGVGASHHMILRLTNLSSPMYVWLCALWCFGELGSYII